MCATKTRRMQLSDVNIVDTSEEGTAKGVFRSEFGEYNVTLKNLLYVPEINPNLSSVGTMLENRYSVTFKSDYI